MHLQLEARVPNHPYSGFTVYRRLFQYVRRHWLAFGAGIIGTIIEAGITAAFLWVIKPLLDRGFIAKDKHFLYWLPIGIVLAFIVRGVGAFLSNYYMAWVGRNVVLQMRQKIFAHL